jgi:hypothetical protein
VTTVGRVVLAGVSDGTAYLNDFCAREASAGGLGVLASLLAQVWDFDSEIATPASSRLNPSVIFGKPIRAYYEVEGSALPPGAPALSVLIHAQNTRWINYRESDPAQPEVPPLPPAAANSNPSSSPDPGGGRTPPSAPPGLPASQYTHHLIRDFMFQDAAAQNQTASGPPAGVTPQAPQQFTVQFTPLIPDPVVGKFTRGTGHAQVSNKNLVVAPVPASGPFTFHNDDVSYSGLLYELVDMQNNPVAGDQFSPNWFGVAVPDALTDFTNVIIYFHPTPNQAGYKDPDYASKSNGGDPTHTNWKDILGYVDRLGSQLAGAVKDATPPATPNQIVIVPIMRSFNVDGGVQGPFGGAGILPRQWYYIVNDILKDLPARLPTLPPS